MCDNTNRVPVREFTVEMARRAMNDGGLYATCTACGASYYVELDAEEYDCHECGAKGTVTSPMRLNGWI